MAKAATPLLTLTISCSHLLCLFTTFPAGKEAFPKALAKHSGYSQVQVHDCAQELLVLMNKAPTASLNAVFKKYSHTKCVARMSTVCIARCLGDFCWTGLSVQCKCVCIFVRINSGLSLK